MARTEQDSDFTLIEQNEHPSLRLNSVIKENQSLYRGLMSYMDTLIIIEMNTTLSLYDLPQIQKNSFNIVSRRELEGIYQQFLDLKLSVRDFEMMCYGIFESLMPMHRKIFSNHINQFNLEDDMGLIEGEFESECKYQLAQIVKGYGLFRP